MAPVLGKNCDFLRALLKFQCLPNLPFLPELALERFMTFVLHSKIDHPFRGGIDLPFSGQRSAHVTPGDA